MGPSSDDWSGIHDINALAAKVRRIIKLIGWTLAAAFTWLQLKDFEFGVVVESTTPELLLKTALVIYYLCWIGGSSFDVSVQQKVYVSDPAGGELKVKTYAAVVGFFIVALLLLWASENEKFLAPMLTLFVIANYFGWRHIVSRMSRAVRVSREKFSQRKNHFRDEQLRLVNNYMTGKWQSMRFAVTLAITLELTVPPPFWVHVVLWGPLSVVVCLSLLPLFKALLVALQYRFRQDEGRLDQ